MYFCADAFAATFAVADVAKRPKDIRRYHHQKLPTDGQRRLRHCLVVGAGAGGKHAQRDARRATISGGVVHLSAIEDLKCALTAVFPRLRVGVHIAPARGESAPELRREAICFLPRAAIVGHGEGRLALCLGPWVRAPPRAPPAGTSPPGA